ncbi:MAG: hypothetical protein F2603_04125 [Actinobacteria bacterium]|uniref:Unannotated protein n=1 Tax=freshwater metagenome TaxID=449393 RepID=A0A6J6ANG9_9ZZZZ|nr:hypothetical protein [Actinomycetota bacterium]
MSNALISLISVIIVIAIAFFLASRFKISSRYERKPEKLNSWNRQDIGEDPSTNGRS